MRISGAFDSRNGATLIGASYDARCLVLRFTQTRGVISTPVLVSFLPLWRSPFIPPPSRTSDIRMYVRTRIFRVAMRTCVYSFAPVLRINTGFYYRHYIGILSSLDSFTVITLFSALFDYIRLGYTYRLCEETEDTSLSKNNPLSSRLVRRMEIISSRYQWKRVIGGGWTLEKKNFCTRRKISPVNGINCDNSRFWAIILRSVLFDRTRSWYDSFRRYTVIFIRYLISLLTSLHIQELHRKGQTGRSINIPILSRTLAWWSVSIKWSLTSISPMTRNVKAHRQLRGIKPRLIVNVW